MTPGPARRAIAFLTPLGGAAAPSPAALVWFPVVGAGLGAVLGLVWWGASTAWPAAVAAALVVAADLAGTGMLHLDGALDAADGLLPHLGRARRLAVMREPTVGAFGITVGGTLLLLRWAALVALVPSVLLLAGLWAASRATMAFVTAVVPYARADGLPSAFVGTAADPEGTGPRAGGSEPAAPGSGDGEEEDGPARPARLARPRLSAPGVRAGLLGLVVAVPCVVAWHPLAGLASLGAGALAACGVVVLARRRVGGYTGDVLGAAGVVLETVALVVAAARW